MKEKDADSRQRSANKEDASAALPWYESLLYWKVELHKLFSGNRTSEIIHVRGSASDYIKTLFPRTSKNIVARHFFVEALNEALNDFSIISLSPSALNHLLDLLVEFKPRDGFGSLVSYLRLGGLAEPNFVPIGGAVSFDLNQKTLETLGTYFEVPPVNSHDPAFLTYVEILNQQLRTNYSGYAVSELLKLKVLRPDSDEFKRFINEYPNSLTEIMLNLSLYASHGYGFDDIKNLFYVSLESGKQVFLSFRDAIKNSGGELEPTEQEDSRNVEQTVETPTHFLRLFDGTVIQINLEQHQVDLLYRYESEDDTQAEVMRVLSDPSLDPDRRAEEATELFARSCVLDTRGVRRFAEEIEKTGASLVTDLDNNRVYIAHEGRQIAINLRSIKAPHKQTYLRYLKERERIPSDPDDIEIAIDETIRQVERAFVAFRR